MTAFVLQAQLLLTFKVAELTMAAEVILVTSLSQSKAVLVSPLKPITPLFHSVMTVMAKRLYNIQP